MSDPRNMTTGILMLPGVPMLVVSQPVVCSDYYGPLQGIIIMGRYHNRVEISRLSGLTQPSLAFIRMDNPSLSRDLLSRIREKMGTSSGVFQPLNENFVAVSALIRDIYGNEALVLRIIEPWEIYHQGGLVPRSRSS